MKIDIEYIKNFLELVLENNHPDFKLNQDSFKGFISTDDELHKLVFHLEILEDQGLLKNSSNNLQGIGFSRSGCGSFSVSIIPLRLTAQGHQFASDLVKPGVIETLKTSFKDAGPSETVKAVFSLGKKALEKKLAELIE
ncbi:hypothetical protein [Photobacterium sp. DNB22_13_2]